MIAGVTAGIVSSVICLGYKYVYTHYTGFRLEEFVNSLFVFTGCMSGSLLAALGYYALSRFLTAPQYVFVFVVFVLMILSLFFPLSSTLPDQTTAPEDFSLLTVPMHVFTGLIITYLVPTIAGPPKLVYND